jgi:phospholipid/cholesterol/gamma-HCH transport system permease protein
LDGAGVAFIIDLQHAQEQAHGTCQIRDLPEKFLTLLQQFQPLEKFFKEDIDSPKVGFLVKVGANYVIVILKDLNLFTLPLLGSLLQT